MTVLWVDNLQWADPMLRDHLGVVVRSLGDLPLLLVTAQRPDPDVMWPPQVDRPLVVQVPLGPLDRGDSLELVRSVLDSDGGEADDDDRVAALVERGGGNPLFLVELAVTAAGVPGHGRAARLVAGADRRPRRPAAGGRSGRSSTTPPCSATTSTIGALARFAQEIGQEFRVSDLDDLARRPGWSSSTASAGSSAATSCGRSCTRR